MTAKAENERLRKDNEALNDRLREAQELAEAQLRNVERLATKAARTDEAEAALARTHADRDAAYKRITRLEGQAEAQDLVLIRFLDEHLNGTSTAGMVLARDLRDRLAKAGTPVKAGVTS